MTVRRMAAIAFVEPPRMQDPAETGNVPRRRRLRPEIRSFWFGSGRRFRWLKRRWKRSFRGNQVKFS